MTMSTAAVQRGVLEAGTADTVIKPVMTVILERCVPRNAVFTV